MKKELSMPLPTRVHSRRGLRGLPLRVALIFPLVLAGGGAVSTSAHLTPKSSAVKVSLPREALHETVLYSFPGIPNGAQPSAGLIADRRGALYGTTAVGGVGGSFGNGTVFKLTPSEKGYTESVLYAFQGGNDGAVPYASLIADEKGALYGTTAFGGGSFGNGTVFKLTPSEKGYTERVLYAFRGGGDGARPYGGLIAGERGALYGTTVLGGPATGCSYVTCGTVFKLTPSGTGYSESVIYAFQGSPNDGAHPDAGLIADKEGALYGTTEQGGITRCTNGCGTVFKLTRTANGYAERVLHRFGGPTGDGAQPFAGLIADEKGALYGTTTSGGATFNGTVFKLTPSGGRYSESVLYSFQAGSDASFPVGGVIVDKTGALYGTTAFTSVIGGNGTVFKLTPSGNSYTESILYHFLGPPNDGSYPYGGVIADESGTLYGTTTAGGATGIGIVFKLTLRR
jgi:uncharacterized repeat protein (TIGR03803 family)